ncbi:MAG: hypothetical protein F6K28_23035 [Microcoleus sp. SIO2G3]|nr:hypothetical protein [Microcoleus sp. SIO2G3]
MAIGEGVSEAELEEQPDIIAVTPSSQAIEKRTLINDSLRDSCAAEEPQLAETKELSLTTATLARISIWLEQAWHIRAKGFFINYRWHRKCEILKNVPLSFDIALQYVNS